MQTSGPRPPDFASPGRDNPLFVVQGLGADAFPDLLKPVRQPIDHDDPVCTLSEEPAPPRFRSPISLVRSPRRELLILDLLIVPTPDRMPARVRVTAELVAAATCPGLRDHR